MVTPDDAPIGWYGKLPTRGDFLLRGLSARWRREWDGWLQRGMALAAANLGAAWLRERLGRFEPWRYRVHAGGGEHWCGIVLASHDRVGRAFPLTVARRVAADVDAAACAKTLYATWAESQDDPDALDAALARCVDAGDPPAGSGAVLTDAPGSLWWPLEAADDAAPHRGDWPPDPAWLLEMLDRQPAAHQSASAE